MALASWMFRGRSLRSGRSIRSRHDSEDDVQLDLSKDTAENAREILLNICKKHGLTEGKRFGYLNAFVKLVSKANVGAGELGYTVEQIQCCLRVALVHEASQVRAAALRAVRYLLKEERDVKTLNSLQYSLLIARCLDVNLRNDMERVQALRLVRRMLVLAPAEFPASLVRSLVSLANGAAEEKDRMLRACLATLSEICVLNAEVFMSCGGVSAISRNILDCQMPRIAESLCGVLLFLLNNPGTRTRAGVQLQALAAPYCDFHWDGGRQRDEREVRFHCSRLALLSVLRSWPGVLHFCHPDNSSGLRSLVDILYVKQLEVRKAVLDLLYDLLGLPQPEWTDEYSVALEAVDPARPRDAWKLSEGFVAAEGRAVLPHLAKHRPNLVEIHLALLLYTFLDVGLLEAIAEVVVSSDTFISVRATILLGELLQLVHTLLPPECCNLTPALPNLLAQASNAVDANTRQQALASVATLASLHQMLKRRPAPASLFLDQLLQVGGWGRVGTEELGGSKVKREKSKLYQLMLKDGDDILRESAVLTNKDGFSWNWNVVRAVLKSRSDSLKKLEDSNHRTFMRRLVHYFKPSSNRFSRVELGNKRQTHMYTLAGCELLDCLLDSDEPEAGKLLAELLADIWVQVDAITSSNSAHDCLFSPQHMSNSLCQDYFLFIGRMCRTSRGMRVLDKAGILQQLLNLVVSTNHECYVKLVVSSLDYSIDGMPRVILSKVLTAPSETSRLYATHFLLVLLRARLPDFSKWGIELLVMQLYDQSRAVSLAAINVLTEAAEEKAYLEAIVALRPSLLHLGDKGLLLLVRFLSTLTGFTFLHDANFVTNQLERWATSYNYRYVRLVEGELHDSMTLHQRGEDGRYSRRVTSAKHCVRDVYIPPHLYGQLVQHDRGMQLLLRDEKLQTLFQCLHAQRCCTEEEMLELKAALWACGHIATSPAGVSLLADEGLFTAVVRLAETCLVYSLRGTAFYVLGLMATTIQGANELTKTGWLCVRHNRHERWPIIEEELDVVDSRNADNVSVSSGAAAWDLEPGGGGSQHSHKQFYIADEDESIPSGEDEGMMLDESTCSARWTDLPGSDGVPIPGHQRKSQTLPHWRSPRGATVPHRHMRSLSESKHISDWIPDTTPITRLREPSVQQQQPPNSVPRADESKSRSNSCTDSSGVSSCDSGLGKHATSERIHTLSPIPSSTSLNTLKSSVLNRRSSQASGRKHSMQGSMTSEGVPSSPETNSSRLSHQDLVGYATLRSLYRHRRPFYSDSSSLAAEELLGFEDPSCRVSVAATMAHAMKERSMDRQYSHPVLCEFEATMPPQLLSGSSSASLAARTYYGSRSNIGRQQGCARESELTQQCYMGICLPRHLSALFPQDERVRQWPPETTRRRGSTSFSEMEQVQEVGEEVETSSSSDSDDPDNLLKPQSGNLAADSYRHNAATCLSCCRRRDRKISTSSYHRYRTDTESSYGGGESPVLYPRRRKSHSTSSCPLGISPGGSVDSGNSLEMGSSQQEDTAPSKAMIRREILKHISRMSNPVWNKMSKQALLQLKQKHASIFQDVCLYSAACHRMASCTYRLVARRFIQELFLDLSFDMLYEEPAIILQMQQPPASSMEGSCHATSPSYSLQPAPFLAAAELDINGDYTTVYTVKPKSGIISALSMKLASASSSSDEKPSKGTIGSSNAVESDKEENVVIKPSEKTNGSEPVPIIGTSKSIVMSGGYIMKSPPLEVVKEESAMSASSSKRPSPQDLDSSISNSQVDEEVAFLNLQFDDIPMIDDTVRTNSELSRTRESIVDTVKTHISQETVKNAVPLLSLRKTILPAGASQQRHNISGEASVLASKAATVKSQVSDALVKKQNNLEVVSLEVTLPLVYTETATSLHQEGSTAVRYKTNLRSDSSSFGKRGKVLTHEVDVGPVQISDNTVSVVSNRKSGGLGAVESVKHSSSLIKSSKYELDNLNFDLPKTESSHHSKSAVPRSDIPFSSTPDASESYSSAITCSAKSSDTNSNSKVPCANSIRNRKLATAAPPNISSLSDSHVPRGSKNVPTSDCVKQNR